MCFCNANVMNQHKYELTYFLRKKNIDIMLIAETYLTNKYNFNIFGFVCHKTNSADGIAHGGTDRLGQFALNEYSTPIFVKLVFSIHCKQLNDGRM